MLTGYEDWPQPQRISFYVGADLTVRELLEWTLMQATCLAYLVGCCSPKLAMGYVVLGASLEGLCCRSMLASACDWHGVRNYTGRTYKVFCGW